MINEAQATGGPTAAETTLGTYQFTRYVRLVLPLDGFVFWVRANLVAPRALFNAFGLNAATYDEWSSAPPPVTVNVRGTVHYETTEHQDETKSYSSNRVYFNTMQHVQDLNMVSPSAIWIGEFQGVRYAFSRRENFFFQAGEHHYVGDALYSVMDGQIVDDIVGFSQAQVVSNSLPIWLSFNHYTIFYGIQRCPVPVYPSYAVPSNLRPPFAAVHVVPSSTQAIAAAPYLGPTLSHYQLTRDTVVVTLYGARNAAALDFVDFVNQFTLDNDVMGIMNMPTMRDEKEAQPELLILAQKKSIEYEVDYYQSTARQIAQQLILQAVPTFVIAGFEPPPPPPAAYVTEDDADFYVTDDGGDVYVEEFGQ